MTVRNRCIVALLFSLSFTVEGEKAFGIQIPHPDDHAVLSAGQVTPPGAVTKAELHGRVLDTAGGPLEGVTVEVLSQESKVPSRTETDAEGEFVISGVTKGIIKVSLSHPEFEPRDQRFQWPGTAAAVVFTLQPRSLSESITVTATRTPQPSRDTPSTVIVVNRTELQHSPAVTLDDTLRQIPVFSLFRRSSSLVAHPTTQGVSLRGIGPSGVSRTLVLWDGSPLNDPFGGWVYWSQLDKTSLERIELSPVGGSSLYGSSALGGVIQVFSRAPENSLFELDVHGGSLATAGGDLLAAYARGPWSGNISGSFLHTDGYFVVSPRDRGSVDDRAGSVHYALRASGFYRPSEPSSLSLHVNHFAEDRDNGTLLQTNETDITSLRARYRREGHNGREWQVGGYGLIERFKSNFTAISADRRLETLTLDQVVPARSAGGSIQWTGLLHSRHLLTSGLDWQWVRGHSEELNYFAGVPSRFVVAGGHQQLGGLYIQDLFTPASHWMIQLSARLDGWTNYDAERREKLLRTGALTEAPFSNQLRGTVDPRVGVSYHPDENVTLRGAYYHSFRAPTLNEFYRSFRVGNVVTLANDQLGPERVKGFEGGADWRLGSRLSARLVAFWNTLDNPVSNITVSVTPTLITRLRQNIGEARAQGLEAEGALQLNREWAFRGAYLLSDSKVSEFPVNRSLESKRLPQVPRHRLTASVVYSNVRILEAFVSTRFVGLQYDDDLNLLPLGNFTVLDFHVSRQLRPSLRFYFSAENLFDRRFAVARTPVESIGAPRLLHAGIKLTF